MQPDVETVENPDRIQAVRDAVPFSTARLSSADPWLRLDLLVLAVYFVGGLLVLGLELLSHLRVGESLSGEVGWPHSAIFLAAMLLGVLVFAFRRIMSLRRLVMAQEMALGESRQKVLRISLTEVSSQQEYQRRLEHELSKSHSRSTELAVLFVDLDRFKQVNELFGHEVGGVLLHEVARRLSKVPREMDTMLRTGSDEFLIIQPSLQSQEGAASLAGRLNAALADGIQVGEHLIPMSISTGIAMSSLECHKAPALLRRAHIALERAKLRGGGTFRFFEAGMDLHMLEQQRLEQDLRTAIEEGKLLLHYQPLFNVNDHKLLGFEALLRWPHAEHGFVSPSQFIPVAEESGMIVSLGEWVLEQACSDALQWAGEKRIAVNLSACQFQDPEFPGKIAAILERTGLPAQRLELEITESMLREDADNVLSMLVQIKALGVRISMDDFGTGHSSLNYLQRFPFDKIKIDQSFVTQLETDADASRVRALLAMGHGLGMVATAEGVESAEQFDYLQLEGCDEAQGFLLGRPMPFEYALALCKVPYDSDEALDVQSMGGSFPFLLSGNG